MPIEPRIASPYGMRQRPSGPRMHQGIDIVAEEGHPLYAVLPGVVTHATDNGAPGFSGYGHTVVVRHDDPKVWTLYAHLLKPAVAPGQYVAQGELLGWVGRSRGRFDQATGQQRPDFFHTDRPHVHFEVRTRSLPAPYGEGNLDPQAWLAAYALALPTGPSGAPVTPPAEPEPAPAEPIVAPPAPAVARPTAPRLLRPAPSGAVAVAGLALASLGLALGLAYTSARGRVS